MLLFQQELNQGNSTQALTQAASAIEGHLQHMRAQAHAERPVWRLGWFYLRAGWPFKQGLKKKFDILLLEFDLLEQDVKTSLAQALKRGAGHGESKEAEPDRQSLLWLQKKNEARLHYKNFKSSIFSQRADNRPVLPEEKCFHHLNPFNP
jgi:hypothetical protein